MTRLETAPTPNQFANAWARGFGAAVREAAGSDLQLTSAEAKTIGDQNPRLAHVQDNAVNYFETHGAESASVDEVVRWGHRYARSSADEVAGRGNRVSLAEGRSLPRDLRVDFFTLRGRPEEASDSLPARQLYVALEEAAVLPGGEVLAYVSEGDSPVLPVTAPARGLERIDAPAVLRAFASELEDGLFADNEVLRDFTAYALESTEAEAFLQDLSQPFEGMTERQTQTREAFQDVIELLRHNLDEVHVVKVGPKAEDGSLAEDHGLYAYFLVGKTRDNKLAGVYFGSVET